MTRVAIFAEAMLGYPFVCCGERRQGGAYNSRRTGTGHESLRLRLRFGGDADAVRATVLRNGIG